MKKNAKGLVLLILVFSMTLFLNSCFTIWEVAQPAVITEGTSFQVDLKMSTNKDDAGAKYGILGLLVPNDWTIDSVYFDGDYSGVGEYLHPDSVDGNPGGQVDYWADSIEYHYPSGPDMQWVVYQANTAYTAGTDTAFFDVHVKMKSGSTLGDFDLGYLITNAGLDFTDPTYWDVSLENSIDVIAESDIVTIADIQDTTGSGSDASVLEDSVVTVAGVVSAESYAFGAYYIQDGTGPWSGVMVYDYDNVAAYGDSILITAQVDEYYGLTELKNVSSFAVLSKGHEVVPTELTTAEVNEEAYEGVLVKVVNAEITDPDMGYGEWEINDGSGACVVDDKAEYYFDPAKYDSVRSLVGVVDYAYGANKIQPRLAYDVEEADESVRIQRIQQVRESALLTGNDYTLLENDTVTITGVVTVRSGLFYAGSGKKYYIQQPGGGPFSGLMVYDYESINVPTVYEGDSISVTGVVVEYVSGGNTTEFNATEELFLWGVDARVDTSDVKTNIFNDSLYYNASTAPNYYFNDPQYVSLNYEAEKWENALIRVSNVKVAEVTPYGVRLDDETGRGLLTSIGYSAGVTMGSPPEGTIFESVTGVIYDHWGNYNFIPRYDSDVVVLEGPPMISNTDFSPSNPQPEDTVTISTSVLDDGTITEVKAFYSVNAGAFTSVDMVNSSGSAYEVKIGPFANKDTISFYVTATDNDVNTASDPETAPDSVYSFVISGPDEVTIYDIQYTDDPSGDSPYVGGLVKFTGTITADTATNASSFFVQDFDNAAHTGAAWNGVMVYSSDHNKYAVGDKVEFIAGVKEYYGLTEIIDVVSSEKVGTGSVTEEVVTSADIAADSASSEPFEGALIKINDVTVTEILTYGDFEVTDAEGYTVQIGGSDAYSYEPVVGDHIDFITGNLTYSYEKYEVLARSDSDFGNIVSIADDKNAMPVTYRLDQNYPNPFNPTTTIQYGIAKEGLVTLTIYNILGQEVKTLVSTHQNAGDYRVRWNGLDNSNRMVSNGIYIYRIVSDNFVQSKKMVFLK